MPTDEHEHDAEEQEAELDEELLNAKDEHEQDCELHDNELLDDELNANDEHEQDAELDDELLIPKDEQLQDAELHDSELDDDELKARDDELLNANDEELHDAVELVHALDGLLKSTASLLSSANASGPIGTSHKVILARAWVQSHSSSSPSAGSIGPNSPISLQPTSFWP